MKPAGKRERVTDDYKALSSNEGLLCQMLENFCEEQGLPLASADEIMFDNLPNEFQCKWLTAFIALWEIEMSDHLCGE